MNNAEEAALTAGAAWARAYITTEEPVSPSLSLFGCAELLDQWHADADQAVGVFLQGRLAGAAWEGERYHLSGELCGAFLQGADSMFQLQFNDDQWPRDRSH